VYPSCTGPHASLLKVPPRRPLTYLLTYLRTYVLAYEVGRPYRWP